MRAGVGVCSIACHSQDALWGSQEGNKRHWGTLGMAKQEASSAPRMKGQGERVSLEPRETEGEESVG